MIDLKRPLEGAPGLLLLAAMVLFGMVIDVAVALALSWVEIKDSIANCLGGVVGAGLGSALAVLGAVHVQRRERRDRLTAPVNVLAVQLGKLHDHLIYLRVAELPPSLHDGLNSIGEELDFSIRHWARYIRAWKSGVHDEADRTEAMDAVRDYIDLVEALSDEVKRLVQALLFHKGPPPTSSMRPTAFKVISAMSPTSCGMSFFRWHRRRLGRPCIPVMRRGSARSGWRRVG